MSAAANFSKLCCVIALALATSAPAQAESKSTAAPAMQAAPSAAGARQVLPVGKARPNLSETECTDAGGGSPNLRSGSRRMQFRQGLLCERPARGRSRCLYFQGRGEVVCPD